MRDSLQPAELSELLEGEQERWNRLCLLLAWHAHLIAMSTPLNGSEDWRAQCPTLIEFLEQHPPPGYVPPPDAPKVRRVR